MSEQPETRPAEEIRGGEDIDWDAVRPGKPLPEKIPPVAPDSRAPYAGRHRAAGS